MCQWLCKTRPKAGDMELVMNKMRYASLGVENDQLKADRGAQGDDSKSGGKRPAAAAAAAAGRARVSVRDSTSAPFAAPPPRQACGVAPPRLSRSRLRR